MGLYILAASMTPVCSIACVTGYMQQVLRHGSPWGSTAWVRHGGRVYLSVQAKDVWGSLSYGYMVAAGVFSMCPARTPAVQTCDSANPNVVRGSPGEREKGISYGCLGWPMPCSGSVSLILGMSMAAETTGRRWRRLGTDRGILVVLLPFSVLEKRGPELFFRYFKNTTV
jgi:hypothetical protein